MKSTLLLLAFAIVVLSSCSTAYKTGQTPDDVYFSPAPPQEEYVQMNKNDDRTYQNDQEYYDDRYLRMKVHNRTQWSDLNDWYYYDNRYSYSSYRNWNNPWSPVSFWNYYYNPYCSNCCGTGGYIKNNIATGKPRVFNLNSYNNSSLTTSNYNNPKVSNSSFHWFDGSRNAGRSSNNNSGGFLRNIITGNNNNSSGSKPGSSSSTGSSGGGGSSSGGSAPVRRF